jgi:uncharacterized membrane protein YfcA
MEIIIIVVAGILVGFINTLSGGGSVISLSLLLILGLPANIANGTNRISIFFQTFSSVTSFTRQTIDAAGLAGGPGNHRSRAWRMDRSRCE